MAITKNKTKKKKDSFSQFKKIEHADHLKIIEKCLEIKSPSRGRGRGCPGKNELIIKPEERHVTI